MKNEGSLFPWVAWLLLAVAAAYVFPGHAQDVSGENAAGTEEAAKLAEEKDAPPAREDGGSESEVRSADTASRLAAIEQRLDEIAKRDVPPGLRETWPVIAGLVLAAGLFLIVKGLGRRNKARQPTENPPVERSAESGNAQSRAPSITDIHPATASAPGARTITVRGNNFDGSTRILFGGVECRPQYLSKQHLTFRTPAGSGQPGEKVEICVRTGEGDALGRFLFDYPALAVSSAEKAIASAESWRLIEGIGFLGVSKVEFEGNDVPFEVVDNGKLLVQFDPSKKSASPAKLSIRRAGEPPAELSF